jgi:hypothetical protein
MKLSIKKPSLVLILLGISLSVIILTLPLELLEFLSIEVVGEPPINGRTWMEGVDELGGEISMRVLAIIGVIIIVHALFFVLDWENKPLPKRDVNRLEIATFLIATVAFFFVNFLIGYSWWDPDAFLGMGSLFIPSIVSLIILGLLPLLFRRTFQLEKKDLATSTENLKQISIFMIIIAFGYGLISTIWHCCSFFSPTIYFFYFIIKLVQLWGMCAFFFQYGFYLFLNRAKPWVAYLIVSVLFGFCYPWHTLAYAFTFTLFGFALCILTRKTGSYLSGLILLYFAYIFHAGLPWNGPIITFFLIYPISLGVMGALIYKKSRP